MNQQDFNHFVLKYSYNMSMEANGSDELTWRNISDWLGHVITIEKAKMDLLKETSRDQRLMMIIIKPIKHRFPFSARMCFSSTQHEWKEQIPVEIVNERIHSLSFFRDFFRRDVDESIQPIYTSLPSTKKWTKLHPSDVFLNKESHSIARLHNV